MSMKIKFLIINFLFFHFLYSQIMLPSAGKDNWIPMQNDQVWVGYKYSDDLPWCRAISVLPFSIEEISHIVGNFDIYSDIFSRIITSKIIDSNKNIVYLKIDMPIFNDRDYIVQYSSFSDNADTVYQWYSTEHQDAPEYDDIVRLHRAAGEWRLTPINLNQTQVSYTWNGELLGNFPGFYLTTAWETQGGEIIEWLEQALEK